MDRTLYTVPFCGYCERVRRELERLNLDYEEVEVPWPMSGREAVFRVSGQRRVPVLVDAGQVIHDSTRIIEHLRRTYTSERD